MKKRVTARELEDLLKEGAGEVVDVRAGWEWAGGRIAGSRHVPLKALGRESEDWERGGAVVLVCKSGFRSERAAGRLREQGFSEVMDLAGGIDAWKAEGLGLETDPGPAGFDRGTLRMWAGLLALACLAASRWWPPLVYVSAALMVGMMFSVLAGWGVSPPADDSSEAACSDGGG